MHACIHTYIHINTSIYIYPRTYHIHTYTNTPTQLHTLLHLISIELCILLLFLLQLPPKLAIRLAQRLHRLLSSHEQAESLAMKQQVGKGPGRRERERERGERCVKPSKKENGELLYLLILFIFSSNTHHLAYAASHR